MSRDMMPSFELYQPDSLEGALELSKDVEKSWLARPAARTATTGSRIAPSVPRR